jgi:hypothetical protein
LKAGWDIDKCKLRKTWHHSKTGSHTKEQTTTTKNPNRAYLSVL